MNAINDDDDLLLEVDTDDEELALDIIRDKTTKDHKRGDEDNIPSCHL